MKAIEKLSKILTWPIVAVLAIGGAAFAAIVIWAPPDMRELLLGADGLVATLVAGYLRSPRDKASESGAWELHDEPRTPSERPSALSRARSEVPPPRRGGFAHAPALIAIAALAAILVAAALVASGCGSSPLRVHYNTLAVVAQVYDAATDGGEAALTAQASACNQVDACLDGVRDAWRPVQVAQATVLLALQSWASALGLWEAAGDHPAFIRAALRALDAVGSGWNTWSASGALVGWTLPAIPPDVLMMARAVGGE